MKTITLAEKCGMWACSDGHVRACPTKKERRRAL